MSATPMSVPTSPARTGVWIGIATISLSFAAYTSALMVRQGSMTGWVHFQVPPILYVNTLVLLASSATFVLGQRLMASGQEGTFAARGGRWLQLTLVLGLLFLGGQVVAWRDLAAQGLYLSSNPGSSFFYVFTVLHALHLLGGIAALGYVLWRLRGAPGAPPLNVTGATALYWHFMDVLWVYLLLVLALRL
jgi:cytochrome c oxidase subunit 3